MNIIVISVLLFASSGREVTETRIIADRIEINHFYQLDGRINFHQLIIYRRLPNEESDYVVDDWIMIDDSTKNQARIDEKTGKVYNPPYNPSPQFWPKLNNGYYRFNLYINGNFIDLRSPILCETWTQYDPEFEDRETWPMEFRRKVLHPKKD